VLVRHGDEPLILMQQLLSMVFAPLGAPSLFALLGAPSLGGLLSAFFRASSALFGVVQF